MGGQSQIKEPKSASSSFLASSEGRSAQNSGISGDRTARLSPQRPPHPAWSPWQLADEASPRSVPVPCKPRDEHSYLSRVRVIVILPTLVRNFFHILIQMRTNCSIFPGSFVWNGSSSSDGCTHLSWSLEILYANRLTAASNKPPRTFRPGEIRIRSQASGGRVGLFHRLSVTLVGSSG